ncbi:VWA domain-containing protein [Enterobacterales bacterium AE_CKDN230030158-1A_HGKHYDSX7]
MLDSFALLLQRVEIYWPWFGLLLPLPIIVRLLPARRLVHSHSVRVPNLPNLLADTPAAAGVSRRKRLLLVVFAGAWFCLVFAITRPQLVMPASYQEISVRDLVLVLDVSGSMATEDMQDGKGGKVSRISAMQEAVRAFIRARPDDNIGLIVFGSQAYPFSPLSRDHQVLLERVGELQPAMAGPQTSIGDALGSTIKMFRNIAQAPMSESGMERMVVLLTDGKDTSSTLPPEVALRLARKEHVTIHTIAMGDDREETINLPLLRKIASETGGTFHSAAQSAQSLQSVYDTINHITPRKVKTQGLSYRRPLYLYPLAVALIGLAFMAWSLRGERKRHA